MKQRSGSGNIHFVPNHDFSYDVYISDPRALNHAKESTLHWACQSEKENEEVVELLLPKLKKK